MNNIHPPTSYEWFGIECGDGWKELYQPLVDFVIRYNEEHAGTDSYLEITQIKEKWGGLRFYWSGENVDKETCDRLSAMVKEAEDESYRVCEMCGTREGVGITVDGWYTTICSECLCESVKKHYVRDRRWKEGPYRGNGKIYIIGKDGNKQEES